MASQLTIKELRAIERKSERQQLLRQPVILVSIIVALVMLLLFAFYPLLQVMLQIVWEKRLDLSVIQKTLVSRQYWQAMKNSIVLGLIVSLLSTTVGFIFAYAVTRTKLPFKRFFHMTAVLPIISPPFVMALAMILLFGRSGVITKSLLGITTANVYGLRSLIIVQTLAMFPLAYLNIKGLLESINVSVEDAARSLGATRGNVFFTVTLPLCMPGVFSSLLIVFMKSISDFGNPQVLGGDYTTLSTQAYLQINGMYNLRAGAFMAFSILLPSMIAFAIQRYWVSRKSFVSVTGKPINTTGTIDERHIVTPLATFCGIISAVVYMFYIMVVVVSFIKVWGVDMSPTLVNYQSAIFRGGSYIKDSFLLGLIATPITTLLGMIIAYLSVRISFPGKRIIDIGSMLTFAVPGLVLGIGYILAFNKPPFLFTGTGAIIVICLVFRNVSIGIEAGSNSLRQIDSCIEEASEILGANPAETFFKVTVPLLKSAIYTTLVNSFVRSMTSISAIIFIVSVRWNLLTVLIMSNVEQNRFGIASAYCVILMVIVLIAFGLMSLLVRGNKEN